MNEKDPTPEVAPAPAEVLKSTVMDYLDTLSPEDLTIPEDIDLVSVMRRGGPGRNVVPLVPYEPRGEGIADAPLFNDPASLGFDSLSQRKQERTNDRIIGYLHAQGYSGIEIAQHLGVSKSTVYNVLQLPWVRELVREEIKKCNLDFAQQKLQASLMDNIGFLQDVVFDNGEQTRDRITAAKELLDRTLGKSNQVVTHRQDVDMNKLSDEALAEIATRGTR